MEALMVLFGIVIIGLFLYSPIIIIRNVLRMTKEERAKVIPKEISSPDKTSLFLAIKHIVKHL
jgi:hypothetical protein